MKKSVTGSAIQLILKFEDDNDIPEKYRGTSKVKNKKRKKDTLVEKRFQKHLQAWIKTIESILLNIDDHQQAWRFIKINPSVVEGNISSITYCKDYLDFTDYLILRRDIQNCDDDELGKLCKLHTAFQDEIQKYITHLGE